ncbi:MAG TPA: uroporphyrinogen decarboxylase family protein [Spirochaetia bacterium]|nr:uroporphyrinogen decarboxylase family protein [Spirochaetales bacterium]HRY79421.1 uroporphyrinogen decarboxylase family protein [Spirochaetia bacterium]
MKPVERVTALFRGEPYDRPPYGLACCTLGASLTSTPVGEYYGDPALYARGQGAVCDLLDPDIVFTPFVFAFEAAAFGAALAPQKDSVPNVRQPPFRTAEDALTGRDPKPGSDRYLDFLVDSSVACSKAFGTERIVAAPIVAPTDLPALLVGIEEWIETLLFRSDVAERLFSKALDHFRSLSEAYRNAGVSILVMPMMFANPRILDERNIRRSALPVLESALRDCPLPVVLHHGGTAFADRIGLYTGLPGLAGFAIGAQDSFSRARELAGPEAVLLGNILGPCFDAYSRDFLSGALRALVEAQRGDRRWIFANSGAELPAWTPPDRLTLVRDILQGRGS